jgi:F420-dependent oxidoreductase-like protein
MQLRIFIEPQQGTTYDAILRLATTAERTGFDGFFSSDHYLHMGDHVSGLPGPTDAWTTLAGLARDTSRLRLGTLVTPVTFRHPGPFAIAVAQIDAMSGGRIEPGLGAGWYQAEHDAYAIPFPELGERFGRLEEYLAVVTGLWGTPTGERFSYQGRHYTVTDSPGLPKPVQQPAPPIVVGGAGPRRTPRLAARYAAEFNNPFRAVGKMAAQNDLVRAACEAIGRDPSSMVFSAALVCVVGATEDEFRARAARVGREPEELRENGACGLPGEVADRLRTYAEAGATRVYLQHLDVDDVEQVELVAAEVTPHL